MRVILRLVLLPTNLLYLIARLAGYNRIMEFYGANEKKQAGRVVYKDSAYYLTRNFFWKDAAGRPDYEYTKVPRVPGKIIRIFWERRVRH